MKKFILGKKVGMTQIFDEEGLLVPVTVIEAGPMTVVQKKNPDTDGYSAIKVGFGDVLEKRLNKPQKGVFTKLKISPKKYMREFRVENTEQFEVGQEIKIAEMFQSGDRVDVTGTSKGKGFAGNIKRHGQKGGPGGHGSMYHRRVGSMGANTTPARVRKGKKMPGHMGAVNCTVQNLNVVLVDGERGILVLRGAVPGPKGGLISIQTSVKAN